VYHWRCIAGIPTLPMAWMHRGGGQWGPFGAVWPESGLWRGKQMDAKKMQEHRHRVKKYVKYSYGTVHFIDHQYGFWNRLLCGV